MAEEILNPPDLRELENKVGRKTPESLLMWMRDAVDREHGWRADAVDRGERRSDFSESFSDKISNLKQEMRSLRSADVRILRQLVAVHEGIEAMRWLMEERDALVSRGSSLTGSLSSLVTVEEPGTSMSPCRENLSPAHETAGYESGDQQPHTDHDESNLVKSYFDMPSSEFTEATPPSPSSSTFEVMQVTQSRHVQASLSPDNFYNSASLSKSQSQDSNITPLKDIKSRGDTIRRALLRSSRVRKEVRADSGIFSSTKQSEETQTEQQPQQSSRDHQNNVTKTEESEPNKETMLLGYDAQWCWVESQDDVTFL
uniref:Leucine rich adaptor protein 1-like n=1 Tax=Labrus bergylta TaxID=56723 RepID=A0A3Q3F9E8_9LABR|nr:leucine rich adaptor protein 1-like [Labrus bergylta]